MTGKNSNQLKNKYVVNLTPNFRLQFDKYNATLLVKVKPDEIIPEDEVLDDDIDYDLNFRPIGHFSPRQPETLVQELIINNFIIKGGKHHLKLNEFVNLFNSHVSNLTNILKPVFDEFNELKLENETLNKANSSLKKQLNKYIQELT